jgi:hypothetical protein
VSKLKTGWVRGDLSEDNFFLAGKLDKPFIASEFTQVVAKVQYDAQAKSIQELEGKLGRAREFLRGLSEQREKVQSISGSGYVRTDEAIKARSLLKELEREL